MVKSSRAKRALPHHYSQATPGKSAAKSLQQSGKYAIYGSSRTIRSNEEPLRFIATADQNFFIKGWHSVEAVNRKLIRPSLNEIKEQIPPRRGQQQKKPVPPDQTNAENFYYVKQMQAKTPMVFVLRDGETLHGTIEWYDKCCLKINRTGEPNLLLYKPSIKYMYKDG